MDTMVFRVRTESNPKLKDDQIVHEFMDELMQKHPQITGYVFERVEDGEYINVLMWGEIEA